MKLPEYPRLKSSDIEWLGRVPQHWLVDRLKRSIDGCRNGIWGDDVDGSVNDVVCIRVADFDRVAFRVIENPRTLRAIPRRERASRELKHGDLLIEKSGGGEKQLVGCVISFDRSFEAVSSNFVARMRPLSGMHSRYWTYVHASLYAGRINYPSIKQTTGIQNLDTGAYLNERFVFPPFDEQRAIADFLDRETARLDTLVGKKWELIEKLKEKRTALISRTVTRGLPPEAAAKAGLNPHPKLKPSGIEWLGDIPENWEVKPLKLVARVGNGSTPNRDNAAYWEEDGQDGHPWLNSSVVNKERVQEAGQFVTQLALAECHLPQIKPPAVLIGITGEGRTRGMATTLMIEATINQHLAFVQPLTDCTAVGYLRRVFDTAYVFLRSESEGGGSTKGAITCEQINFLKIPIPQPPEQAAIADYLDRETAKIDKMIEKVEAAIEKLQEYRTALITAAVTGKIDVRGEANSVGSTGALAAGTLPT